MVIQIENFDLKIGYDYFEFSTKLLMLQVRDSTSAPSSEKTILFKKHF